MNKFMFAFVVFAAVSGSCVMGKPNGYGSSSYNAAPASAVSYQTIPAAPIAPARVVAPAGPAGIVATGPVSLQVLGVLPAPHYSGPAPAISAPAYSAPIPAAAAPIALSAPLIGAPAVLAAPALAAPALAAPALAAPALAAPALAGSVYGAAPAPVSVSLLKPIAVQQSYGGYGAAPAAAPSVLIAASSQPVAQSWANTKTAGLAAGNYQQLAVPSYELLAGNKLNLVGGVANIVAPGYGAAAAY